jgi:hypothetical protein
VSNHAWLIVACRDSRLTLGSSANRSSDS